MMDEHRSITDSPRWLKILLPALIVVLTAVHLYCPPSRAAELEVIPDSVEYSVAGHRFATTGRYEIVVNGRPMPPRYPPGFSVLFLAPIYAMAPGQIGNGIFAVWIAGIVAALFAYLVGNRIAGPWGGTLAAVLLLQQQQFLNYTQVIMTDVPAVALGLAACWMYLRICEMGETSHSVLIAGQNARSDPRCEPCTLRLHPAAATRYWLLAGLTVAVCVAIRPLTGLLIVPFLLRLVWTSDNPKLACRHLLALTLPGIGVIAATSIQQWHAFGDPRRTGYQFWLPVPYDFFSLTFSARYLRDNLRLVQWPPVWGPLIAGAMGMVFLRRRRKDLARLTRFILLGVLPVSVVHVFYFFSDIRFHFLLLAMGGVVAGAGIAQLVSKNWQRTLAPALPLLTLCILIPGVAPHALEEGAVIRYRVATTAARLLPPDALLITGVDPCYMEQLFARGTARRVFPINRDVPYANAVIAYSRIAKLNPPPRNAADQTCIGLKTGGALAVYSATADESIEMLSRQIAGGAHVYVEILSTRTAERGRVDLERAFRFRPVSPEAPWLMRVSLR